MEADFAATSVEGSCSGFRVGREPRSHDWSASIDPGSLKLISLSSGLIDSDIELFKVLSVRHVLRSTC
jgi:hypothetical protein